MSNTKTDLLKNNPYKNLSDGDFYLLFTQKKWDALQKEERIAVLQEVENRQAQLVGRKPLPVRVKKLDSEGYCSQKEIVLDEKYIEDNSIENPVAALSTMLHEGRHAYQHTLLFQALKQGVIEQNVLMEWLGDNLKYFGGVIDDLTFSIYAMQAVEIDARLFALESLVNIREHLSGLGENTREFDKAIADSIQAEYRHIDRIREYLTIQKLDELSEMIVKAIKEIVPDLDTRSFSLFDEARLVLENPSMKTEDVFLLIIQMRRGKLDTLDKGRLDKISDTISKKTLEDKQDCNINKISPLIGRMGGKMRG